MKTYYFTCQAGHIGGSGIVSASTKKKAVVLANEAIKNGSWNTEPITAKDLIEHIEGTSVLITNGDY